MKQTGLFFIVSAFLCLSFRSANASIEEAMKALKEKDIRFAVAELNRLVVEEQDDEARYQLGILYEQGNGVEKNATKAFEYFKAASSTNPNAALKMGNYYYQNENIENHYDLARQYFKFAADKGHYVAQYNLALMMEEGIGGNKQKDPVKAFPYYMSSASQGYHLAQNALGRMYVEGIGTTQNYMRGMAWYRLAADQGHVDSQIRLADLFASVDIKGVPANLGFAHAYYNIVAAFAPSPHKEKAMEARDALTEKMKAKDIDEAQQYAQRWRIKSRLESYPPENFETVSVMDENMSRKADKKSKEKKKQIITVATKLEDLLIEEGLSRRDLFNAVENDDFSAILTHLNKKQKEGDSLSLIVLGDLYALGQGMEQNPEKARALYQQAVDKGNDFSAIGAFRLAPFYCQGNGIEQDMVECYKWFVVAEAYANEANKEFVTQAMKLMNDSLPKEQLEEGKKRGADYLQEAKSNAGFLGAFKASLFGSPKKQSEPVKKETAPSKDSEKTAGEVPASKEPVKEPEKKPEPVVEEEPEEDFFPEL